MQPVSINIFYVTSYANQCPYYNYTTFDLTTVQYSQNKKRRVITTAIKLIDIARMANVSKATASRALCNSPLVKDETRERIQRIAEYYNYQPNSLAQAVATKHSGIIAFLEHKKSKPYIANTFFGPVLEGAMSESARLGYHIVLAAADSTTNTFDEHFIKDSIDGAMLTSFAPQEVIAEFERRGIPLVIINDFVPFTTCNDFILDDNYGGAWTMMEHLMLKCGRKKVAFISERLDHPSYMLRYRAYVDFHMFYHIPFWNSSLSSKDAFDADAYHAMLKIHGLPDFNANGYPVLPDVPVNSFEGGENIMNKILNSGELPDAVFVFDDIMALGAISAIKKAGLKIPEDIAVGGYDDIESSCISAPPLTTVCVDRERIGREAVRLLLRRIAHQELPSSVKMIPNRLIVREST